jgi:HEAT repeat protein
VTFSLPATRLSASQLVEYLADPHRYVAAYQQLLGLGAQGCAAARDGLAHASPRVRAQCCRVLDHLMDPGSVPALLSALDDPAEEVRVQALHALACDRCKDGACRPAATAVLPSAVRLLRNDASAQVRARAAELAGAWVHTHPAAAAALVSAATGDPSPAVRKKASWYAPGGPIYRRTRPAEGLDCRAAVVTM